MVGIEIFQELSDRKSNVYATLVKLQEEVSQITKITEILKDNDNIKDSKTFVEEIKKEFGVCIPKSKIISAAIFLWFGG